MRQDPPQKTQTRVLLFSVIKAHRFAVDLLAELSVLLDLFGWKGHAVSLSQPAVFVEAVDCSSSAQRRAFSMTQ
jgi:hypothetical protein